MTAAYVLIGALLVDLAASAWGGLCWWLRGGAFGRICRRGKATKDVLDLLGALRDPYAALTEGFEPGTQLTRGVSLLLLALPFALFDWHLLALWPALWISVAALGWGSYMDMGDADEPDNEITAGLLRGLGLRDGTELYDFCGMTLTGFLRGCLLAAVMSALGYPGWPMLILAGMGVVYWICWRLQKRLPRAYTEIAEMAVGAIVGGGLRWAVIVSITAMACASRC